MAVILSAALLFNGCGAQDYATRPPENTDYLKKAEPGSKEAKKPLMKRTNEQGYVWSGMSWIGVSDDSIENLKCRLKDRPDLSHFDSLGASILGGAIIGLVIRTSGSWFFGQPIEPGPGHWFWNRLDQTVKIGGQGLSRGALFAAVCETLLAGDNFTPLTGFLGQDFSALSAAIALGGLASIAASPYVDRKMGAPVSEPEFALQSPDSEMKFSRRVISTVENWSRSSDLGRRVRYRIVPGVTILGIGGAVGLVMYGWLQGNPRDEGEMPESSCPSQAPNVTPRNH
jgi:hypothetical protein